MSEVEALLSVDRGEIPPGALAFFPRDQEAPIRRLRAALAIFAALCAGGCYLAAGGLMPTTLLALAAAMLGITATRTIQDQADSRPVKKPTVVVTPTGIIVRDDFGLRTWTFDQLAEAVPVSYEQRVALLLVKRDGSRDVIDHMAFARGEGLREIIRTRMARA
ncbi:MAG TPA: hypothetical protein VMU50_16665 [Polyangia bacterium]|nr:hypothetical protein [Polyangia bacterium]